MSKPCSHGVILPRGLQCDRGYLKLRVVVDGEFYRPGMGPHTDANEKTARLVLEDIRHKMRLGIFKIPVQIKRISFEEAADTFWQKHFIEYRDPETGEPRSESSLASHITVVNDLKEYFGKRYLDAIKPKDIVAFKNDVVEICDLAPATFNKKKAILSSLFSQMKRWVALEEIPAVKLPSILIGDDHTNNPCEVVPDFKEKPRSRVASTEELKKIKIACFELHDYGLWDIIKLALETTLRKADLEKMNNVTVVNGQVRIKQGKTGHDIVLPALVKPTYASVYTNLRKRWLAACKLADVVNLQFRDLRRTGAQMLLQLNASTKLISQTLGHKSEQTTEWYLQHENTDTVKPLIEARKKVLESL